LQDKNKGDSIYLYYQYKLFYWWAVESALFYGKTRLIMSFAIE